MSFGSSDASFAKFCSAFLDIRTASCSSAVRRRMVNRSSFDTPCLISSALRDSMFERTISWFIVAVSLMFIVLASSGFASCHCLAVQSNRTMFRRSASLA